MDVAQIEEARKNFGEVFIQEQLMIIIIVYVHIVHTHIHIYMFTLFNENSKDFGYTTVIF